jgi:hypothetical protein
VVVNAERLDGLSVDVQFPNTTWKVSGFKGMIKGRSAEENA